MEFIGQLNHGEERFTKHFFQDEKDKFMKIITIIICTPFFIQGCEKIGAEYPLFIQNNSQHSLSVFFNDDENHKAIYPDTSISITQQGIIHVPKGEKEVLAGSTNWKSVFEVSAPKDTLSIIIMHSDTLAKYSWLEIRNTYNILKRYDVSYQDLERIGWTLHYPSTAEMEGIKMYPPE